MSDLPVSTWLSPREHPKRWVKRGWLVREKGFFVRNNGCSEGKSGAFSAFETPLSSSYWALFGGRKCKKFGVSRFSTRAAEHGFSDGL